MTGTHPADFGHEFASRLEATLVATGDDRDQVHVCPSGLTVIRNADGRSLSYIGCPACIGHVRDQDEKGEPTVGGEKLLRASDVGLIPEGVGPEVTVNLWVCATCKLPIQSYLPTFAQEVRVPGDSNRPR